MEGGYQVNKNGERFSDESLGYSEQAEKVLAQPGSIAWSIYDERLHTLMQAFDDYQDAMRAGAITSAESMNGLAKTTGIKPDGLTATKTKVENVISGISKDPFSRDFGEKPPLVAPFYAARITGALFHTQGGLVVNHDAQVVARDGTVFPNLFAGGGAARGISGAGADGYMAGNGLMTATTFGKLAGRAAAKYAS